MLGRLAKYEIRNTIFDFANKLLPFLQYRLSYSELNAGAPCTPSGMSPASVSEYRLLPGGNKVPAK